MCQPANVLELTSNEFGQFCLDIYETTLWITNYHYELFNMYFFKKAPHYHTSYKCFLSYLNHYEFMGQNFLIITHAKSASQHEVLLATRVFVYCTVLYPVYAKEKKQVSVHSELYLN